MKTLFDRRKFLKTSAALAGTAAAGFSCVELAERGADPGPDRRQAVHACAGRPAARPVPARQHRQRRGSRGDPGRGRSADARNRAAQ